jgi:hypothetical protein
VFEEDAARVGDVVAYALVVDVVVAVAAVAAGLLVAEPVV